MSNLHHIHQVPPQERWPGGDSRSLAVLKLSLEALSEHYGIEFEEDYDDLDYYFLAAIQLPDHSQVWLTHYRGEPESETTVTVDVDADFPRTLHLLAKVLSLSLSPEDKAFTWISPRALAA